MSRQSLIVVLLLSVLVETVIDGAEPPPPKQRSQATWSGTFVGIQAGTIQLYSDKGEVKTVLIDPETTAIRISGPGEQKSLRKGMLLPR